LEVSPAEAHILAEEEADALKDEDNHIGSLDRALDRKWWNPVSHVTTVVHFVEDTAEDLVDTVKDVAEEAVDATATVLNDVANAAASVVADAHDAIVDAYGTIGAFLEEHLEHAINMLSGIFSCMVDIVAPIGDCVTTWVRQAAECFGGSGCQLSIGYPKCSQLDTKQVAEIRFIQDPNATMHEAHAEGVLEHGLTKGDSENETKLLETNDDNQIDSIENEAGGLMHLREDGTLITGSWETGHGHANASDAYEVTTSGGFTLLAGVHMNVNLDSGRVTASIKAEFEAEANLNVAASRTKTYDIPRRFLPKPHTRWEVLRKYVMIGKIPVEIVISVRLVHEGSVTVSGAVSAGVKATQKVDITSTLAFNFEKLHETPSWDATWTWWDPTIEPSITATATIEAVYHLHPVFELKVNKIPLIWEFGPTVVVTATATFHSNKCSNANFQVSTNLRGGMELGMIDIDPAAMAYAACMAMKQQIGMNPGVAVANCLAKAALNFDIDDALGEACNVMKSTVPSISAIKFPLQSIGPFELFSYDYGAEICLLSSQEKCVNIKMVNKAWGQENSWVLGACHGSGYRAHETSAAQNCCLPSGSVELKCKDSYGDGWHGGYLLIGDTKYCENFGSGHSRTVSIAW